MTDSSDISKPASREAGGETPELLPAWRELDGALRAFFARRVPASDVDDLVQDCWLKVNEGLPDLRDRDRLGSWIFRIARHLIVDQLRGRQKELRADSAEGAPEAPAEILEPDVHGEVAAWLEAFVDRLPERYAEVLRLSELQEISHREIAERLGLSVSGVKSRVQRGRALLRDKLLACCSFEFDRRGRVLDHERNTRGPCDC